MGAEDGHAHTRDGDLDAGIGEDLVRLFHHFSLLLVVPRLRDDARVVRK